jgi:hypothetical protein
VDDGVSQADIVWAKSGNRNLHDRIGFL